MPDASFDLGRLLAPMELSAFFADYYERAPLVLERRDEAYYQPLLTLDGLDSIVTSSGLRHPAIRLVNHGEVVSPADYTRDFPWGSSAFTGVVDADRVAAYYQQGATIILEALHRQWLPLATLCRSLEAAFGFPVQTNTYLTPPQSQGFAAHYDSHDVFVLQVAGGKRWRIYAGPEHLPGRRQPFDAARHQPGGLVRDLELRPGDLLYLPRGYMHEAATSDEVSLHITVGLLPYTWHDVVSEALRRVDDDPAFRTSLPPTVTSDPAAAAAVLQDGFAERLAVLASVDLAAVFDQLAVRFSDGRLPLVPGALSLAAAAEAAGLDSRVRRRDGIVARLETADGEVSVRYHGKRVAFPDYCREPLGVLAGGATVMVAALPALDDAGRLVLVRRLIRESFLELAP